MKKLLSLWITVVIILFQVQVSEACTGITLTTKDNFYDSCPNNRMGRQRFK